MRRRRRLSDEERALWSRITAQTVPLTGAAAAARPVPDLPPEARPTPPKPTVPKPRAPDMPGMAVAAVPLAPFRIGQTARPPGLGTQPAVTLADHLHAAPLRMDSHTHKRLKKGRLTPQARIDLHGMTLAVAQPALTGFVLRARAEGLRLVLVITGKGKGSAGDPGPLPTRPGALRHHVPHWLHMPPLAGLVAQVVPAHDRHGGGGAYYVWLRR